MGAMKAWVTGGVGVFSEQINTITQYAVDTVAAGMPDNVRTAIAQLAVGLILGLVAYYVPNTQVE